MRNEPEQVPRIESVMRQRTEMVLAICKKYQYQTLILGAWGCGVFRNDPENVAAIFSELLLGKYKNQFERVVFSVYAKDDRFIRPFQEEFSCL